MTTARITAVMLDGTKHEATGAYMALADRVAFERRYSATILEMSRAAQMLDAEGNVRPDADISGLREERTAFFAWRVLQRAGQASEDYDQFLEAVEEITIDTGEMDPTGPVQAPGT